MAGSGDQDSAPEIRVRVVAEVADCRLSVGGNARASSVIRRLGGPAFIVTPVADSSARSVSARSAASPTRTATRTGGLASGSSSSSLSARSASSPSRARSGGAPGLSVSRMRRVSIAASKRECGAAASMSSVVEPAEDERLATSIITRSSGSRRLRAAWTIAKFGAAAPKDHHCSRPSADDSGGA